jgi:bifunctional NMN adenylyltransferase/nudix hydrolase
MKPSYGVIVGRFQVNDLHDGHMELFRQVKARHNGVIVFVGSHPAGLSKNHPLNFEVRRRMIQAKFPDFIVRELKDTRDDISWSKALDAAITSAVEGQDADFVLYGGRDSFVPHYSGKFKPVELILPLELAKIKGTDIRDRFATEVIESSDFRAGMIYASAHQYAVVYPTVDVAIFTTDYSEMLMGRKPTDPKNMWRFIGGFAEKGEDRSTYESGARTEALEEAHADTNEMEYIGSAVIPDWRMAGLPDKGIKTVFFATTVMSMGVSAGDDIEEVRWFKTAEMDKISVVDTHKVLFALLKRWFAAKQIALSARGVKQDSSPALPTIYSSTDRPESAGNTLRQAINKEERETGALKLVPEV